MHSMIKNETERGWIAGLLEGEGCFSLSKGKLRKDGTRRLFPEVSVMMLDEDIIKRVADLIDYRHAIYYRPADKCYVVRVRNDDAIELMLTIRDLMGERRREKIDSILAIDYRGTFQSCGPKPG